MSKKNRCLLVPFSLTIKQLKHVECICWSCSSWCIGKSYTPPTYFWAVPHCQTPALFGISKILSPNLRYLDVWSCYKVKLPPWTCSMHINRYQNFTHVSLVWYCAIGLYQCHGNALWCQYCLIDKYLSPEVYCASQKLLGVCYGWCIGRVKKFCIPFWKGPPSPHWLWSSQIMNNMDTLKQHCIGYWPPCSASWCMGQFSLHPLHYFSAPQYTTLWSRVCSGF